VHEGEFAGILPAVTTGDPPGGTLAEPAREQAGPAAGETIGKYRLDRVIGAGGMGIVWAAFDPDLERAVAIKLLRAGDAEATLRSRLLREARAMARLKHPNVLTVYEVGTDRNRDYIAMELVDGESLDIWLAGRPPKGEVVAALLAAGQGLAAAHGAGLVHRDFKPHNVLRSRDGHVYVTDFGLARGNIEEGVEVEHVAVAVPVAALPDQLASALRRPLDSLLDSPLTQTGVLIGTPAYMAPEQFAGRAPCARSDQFAFCITAWEALTGRRPFAGSTLAELESAARRGERAGAAELSPAVRAVLERGLAPSLDARWPDMPSLLRALAEASAEAPAPPRSRRRWIAIAGVAAVAAGASVALTLLSSRGGSDSGECRAPEEAFGDAWSEARRTAVRKAHPEGGAIGAIILLDGIRKEWLRSYAEACAAPPTQDTREQLSCLERAQKDIAAISAEIARPGSVIKTGEVGLLSATVGACDQDSSTPGFPRALDFQFTPTPPLPPPRPATP
jgi:serine/threonine protein kinase